MHAARELLRLARHARQAEDSVDVPNPAEQRAALERARVARPHLAEGRRVRAIDRDNVGHVLDIDDTMNVGDPGALTDGLLILRFLFGFTGATLTNGAVAMDCGTRCNSADILTYLQTLD